MEKLDINNKERKIMKSYKYIEILDLQENVSGNYPSERVIAIKLKRILNFYENNSGLLKPMISVNIEAIEKLKKDVALIAKEANRLGYSFTPIKEIDGTFYRYVFQPKILQA